MSSTNDLIASIRAIRERVEAISAGIAASRSMADDLAERTRALGMGSKATQVEAIAHGLEERQAAASTWLEAIKAIEAQAEALRGSEGTGSTPPRQPISTPPPEPPDLTAPGYPADKSHTISWSDLHHVLNGDPDNPLKGGHAYGTGRPGKTEFPESWGDEDIREALTEVAASPTSTEQRDSGKWLVDGIHRGVEITAIVRPDGGIEAGWPTAGPGVKRNPR